MSHKWERTGRYTRCSVCRVIMTPVNGDTPCPIPCVCEGNWRNILAETKHLFGRKFKSKYNEDREFTYFGLVWGDDDFYYGMWNKEDGMILATCVGTLETNGFELLGEEIDGSYRP